MVSLITDGRLEEQLITARRAAGTDKYDEVWEGVYVMGPMADNEHQDLTTELATILRVIVTWSGLGDVYAGINVSDRKDDWTENYRCPDVAVFLKGTKAENCKTHWFGGPDFAIEIVSTNDRTLEKLPFYAAVGTEELLVIDRHPWAITLYRRRDSEMVQVDRSTPERQATLSSKIIPLTWQLAVDDSQPRIELAHTDGVQKWTVFPVKG
jgi:Uma2 family endonuclease